MATADLPASLGHRCTLRVNSWYLSNDFQMFLTAPLVVFVLMKNYKVGTALVVVLFFAASGITTFVWDTNNFTWSFPGVKGDGTGMKEFYERPYCRYLPYLFGIVFGYLYQKDHFVLTP